METKILSKLASDYFSSLEPPRTYSSGSIMDAYKAGYLQAEKDVEEIVITMQNVLDEMKECFVILENEHPITEQDFL
jgi:hypothetical protein